VPVYHLELRQFPRSMARFNLSGQAIGPILLLWAQERIIELDDEKWSPAEATLTIIRGPEIPVANLSMGRGWRTALREGEDVTEQVLSEARKALTGGAPDQPSPVPVQPLPAEPVAVGSGDQLALGVELAGLLGADPVALLTAWRDVAARSSGLAPSDSLALAERELGRRGEQA
jgi:hypothetical protein